MLRKIDYCKYVVNANAIFQNAPNDLYDTERDTIEIFHWVKAQRDEKRLREIIRIYGKVLLIPLSTNCSIM